MPNFRPDTRGRRCSLYLGSLAQLCCGEGGTLQTSLACVRSARSVWSTLSLPQLTVACASRVYTAQAPGCFAGALSKAGLHSVHFPGLSCSGSVSRVLHKGTDSAGCVFCALPRSEQLRWPGAWWVHCPRWAVHVNQLPGPSFSVSTPSPPPQRAPSQVCCVSPLGSWSKAVTLLADVNRPGSQEDMVSNWGPAHRLLEGAISGAETAPCLPTLAVARLPLCLRWWGRGLYAGG